uniref:Uncharacterized protein n=1 Tax=Palpitomonas bilix TaxID=652834 RepID=A0A7S3D6E6_9EUKA|mmetsp:Transcript_23826/g.60174  ORF Transcript_23826/g.60174 Transcript_23826/m.60174 type:complete len:224 (+) Transcript_23826:1171-1842(+)|eukprot:CAMPEP_0113866962 /NCGR_PEP_ID=MMETSP0780_2-20120614/159_1 /TAXON_ID=652834 /ORGANISM="Palpitomonas bilix" /LENGTH=223 /DNA_ID=CAMNT_0000851861 /DNA_START=494 /DNA_END=1165 /DNA_ORIENTATION=- /assembly_acc=CAM_ASM_000599
MTTDLLTDDSARVQKILDNKYAFGANFLPKKEECDEPFTTTSQCKSPFTTMKLSCCHDEDASEHDILVVRAGNDHEERMQIPVAEVLVDENRVTRTSDNRIRPQERDEQQQITLDRLCPGQPTVVPRVPATIEWKEGKQDVVLGDAAAAAKNFEEAEQEKKRALFILFSKCTVLSNATTLLLYFFACHLLSSPPPPRSPAPLLSRPTPSLLVFSCTVFADHLA